MILESYEINSPLWEKLKAHHTNKLAALRERNDANHTEIETAKLRGEIRAIKDFLLLETPAGHALDDAA